MPNFERNLIYKVYEEDGTFIETLNDVISTLSIERSINSGDGEFRFELARKMDDFDEDVSIKFNNRIKVYLKDSYNTTGTKLVAYGYIVSYNPYLKGKKEGVEVTCLSAVSKLSNDFYRTGTNLAASDLGVELSSQRTDEMMSAIITHYRSVETDSMINAPAGLTATTDNSGSPISFDHRFFNMKHLDALRETSKFFPRNKDAGYWFYWRIDTSGNLVVKNISTTADHTFLISKHVKEITGKKTIEGMVNRVYFWNEKGTVDPDYLKLTTDDTTSQGNYDVIADYITDSKITNPSAAGLLSESKVYDKKDPKVQVKVTLNGVYDLSSIEPGETCQILNLKNNPFKFGSDTVLVIHSIRYETDQAILEISEASDSFEDIVESERQRLDKEMTWFGYITQQLTAAQLGPANRTWTTNIIFSAASGGDAYRQVDWTAGTVWLPTSSGASAGKRVIVAGSTGLMAASTDYYIYLDEGTFNVSAANVVTGTGTMEQGGDDLLDAGKTWSNDQYKGYIVTIGGQTKIIKSNTATVLTIEDRWTIVDTVGAYTIKKMSFEVSSDKETISSLTKIIFSNVRASSSVTEEVSIFPGGTGGSPNSNIILNGSQIAKDSITANEIYSNYIYAGTIDADQINVGILTGFIIQTAAADKRIKISSSPQNRIQFLDGVSERGYLEIDDDGEGGYYLKLGGPGGLLEIGSSLGASNTIYASMPWFEGAGTASSGQVVLYGSPNYVRKVGLEWTGGGAATFSLNLGAALAKMSSEIDMDSHKITELTDPTANQDAATKKYVDDNAGGTFSCSDLSSCSLSSLGTRPHSQLTTIGVSDHHSSTSNGYNITPTTVTVGGACKPSSDNSYDLGATPSNYWRKFYLEGNMYHNEDYYPNASNTSNVGFSTRYLHQLYTNFLRYKDVDTFQTHDDIALIKGIKTKQIKVRQPDKLDKKEKKIKGGSINREIWDETTLPKEVVDNGFINGNAMTGFLIGTLKQLIDKVEKLEQRVDLK